MPEEDATLSDFVGDETADEPDGEDPDEEGAAGTENVGDAQPPGDTDPAEADGGAGPGDEVTAAGDSVEAPTITASWSPEGGPCDRCGETVGRRWRDGRSVVCTDCKDW